MDSQELVRECLEGLGEVRADENGCSGTSFGMYIKPRHLASKFNFFVAELSFAGCARTFLPPSRVTKLIRHMKFRLSSRVAMGTCSLHRASQRMGILEKLEWLQTRTDIGCQL
jgi:hypothetical protein